MMCRWPCWMVWTWIFVSCPLMAVEILEGPAVEVRGNLAVIRWTTDVTCGTRVRFGLDPNHLDQRAEAPGVRREHHLVLQGLAAGRTYHYRVGTARVTLKEGSFAVAGVPAPPAGGGAPETSARGRTGNDAGSHGPEPGAAPALPRAPPAQVTWGNPASLRDHFERHGADFRAASPEDYAAQAWRFLQRAIEEGLPAKMDDTDGTLRVYDAKTGAFAAFHRDGRTKTYFKPRNPDYWGRQPGRAVKLRRER